MRTESRNERVAERTGQGRDRECVKSLLLRVGSVKMTFTPAGVSNIVTAQKRLRSTERVRRDCGDGVYRN